MTRVILFIYLHGFEYESYVNGKGNRVGESEKGTGISGNDRYWRLDKSELYGNKIILDWIFWKWKVP